MPPPGFDTDAKTGAAKWNGVWDRVVEGASLWKAPESAEKPCHIVSWNYLASKGHLGGDAKASDQYDVSDVKAVATANAAADVGRRRRKDRKRIFVPLGGDCAFICHAYDRGCNVTVVEWCAEPVARIAKRMEERGQPLTATTVAGARGTDVTVHTSADGRVQFWQCALADCNAPVDSFDVVYDKDAFHAIPVADRVDYAAATVSRLRRPFGVYNLVGSASALVIFICVLCSTLRAQILRSICTFTHTAGGERQGCRADRQRGEKSVSEHGCTVSYYA
jgi:hypothetical protein